MVPDVFYYSSFIGKYLWIFKIEILAGIFLGLSFFEYFYRAFLRRKREIIIKKINSLINELLSLKSQLIIMEEKTRDELEHDSFNQRLDSVIVQMNSGFEVIVAKLESVLIQVTKTNGRVTKLEEDTDFIRVVKKYKWMVGLILLGLGTLSNIVDIKSIIRMIF